LFHGSGEPPVSTKETPVFLWLGIILLLGWLFGFIVFHVSSWLIHLLILAALISFVVHVIDGGHSHQPAP
jgi:hypothetical protein